MNEGELDDVAAMYAIDVVAIDRRSVVSVPILRGRAEIRENLAALRDVGFTRVRAEVIAVRGDRLVLHRHVFSTDDNREMKTLGLNEWDNGEVVRRVVFDEDALADAVAELEDRYLAGEGAPHAHVLRAGIAATAATGVNDFEAMGELLSPDFVFVDHTPIGFGTGDRGRFIAASNANTELGIRSIRVNRVIHVSGNAALGVQDVRLLTEQDSEYGDTSCIVMSVDPSGRINRMEWFDIDQFDAALTRLDELGATDSRHPRAENALTRAWDESIEHAHARRWDQVRAGLAGDFVRLDRRRGISAPTANGAEDFMAAYAAWFDVGFDTVAIESLAVRGDRLALGRFVWRADDGREVAFLGVYELDEAGFSSRAVHFDEDALTDAVAELEERYLVGEGAPHARLLRAGIAATAAAAVRDFDALRELLSPEFALVDRRPIGFGALDREQFIALINASAGMGLQVGRVNRALHIVGNAILTVMDVRDVTEQDSEYGRESCVVSTIDPSGRIDRMEGFDITQFDAALARLDELGAGDRRHPRVENVATRALDRDIELAQARHFDELRAMYADEFVRLDRRSGVSAPTANGPDEFVAAYSTWFDVGFEELIREPIAVRGDRLTLNRFEWRSTDGREVVFLGVCELDEHRRFFRDVHFDEAALVDAIRELDERYLIGEGARHARVLQIGIAGELATPDTVGALLSPDFVYVDHRPIGFGEGDREYFVRASRTSEGLATNLTRITRVVHVSGNAVLAAEETRRVGEQGSDYAWLDCVVMAVDASDLIAHLEYFDLNDFGAALARLDELGATPTEPPTAALLVENQLSRGICTAFERLNRGERETTPDGIAPDIVRVDRRRGISAPTVLDEVDYHANATAIFEVFGTVTPEVLAVRGDRLALIRLHCGDAIDGFELELLCVYEANAEGQLAYQADFDGDDLTGAYTELEDRWRGAGGLAAETHAALTNEVTRSIQNLFDRAAEGIFGMEGLVTDEVVRFDTRRSVSTPTLHGRTEFEENLRAIYDVFDGGALGPIAIRGERVALMRVVLSHDGFEASMLGLYETNEQGLISRGTTFDEGDLDTALDALDDRYVAGEGLEQEYIVRRLQDSAHARRSRSLEALGALCSGDFALDDHRRIGYGAIDARAMRAAQIERLAQTTKDRSLHRWREIQGDVVLAELDTVGTTPEGNEYEWSFLVIWHLVAGKWARLEMFDLDDYDAAHARFEELGAAGPSLAIDNAALRALVRGNWLVEFEGHDIAAAMADDLVVDDRRRGVSLPELHGAEEVAHASRIQEELFGRTTMEPVAVRGERLVLVKTRAVAESGFELIVYGVFEANGAGQFCAMVFFDEGDLPRAVDELERCYLASGDAPPSYAVGVEFWRCYNARDWGGIRELLGADARFVDHRPVSGGTFDDTVGFVEYMKGLVELAPDLYAFVTHHIAVGRRCVLASTFASGTSPDGLYIEFPLLSLGLGAERRSEIFAPEQLDLALARFHELEAESG